MKKLLFMNKFYFYAPDENNVSEIAKFKIERLNKRVGEILPILKNPHCFGVFINKRAFDEYCKLVDEYLLLAKNENWY